MQPSATAGWRKRSAAPSAIRDSVTWCSTAVAAQLAVCVCVRPSVRARLGSEPLRDGLFVLQTVARTLASLPNILGQCVWDARVVHRVLVVVWTVVLCVECVSVYVSWGGSSCMPAGRPQLLPGAGVQAGPRWVCLPLVPCVGSLHACAPRPPASAFCRQGGVCCTVPHASHLLHPCV